MIRILKEFKNKQGGYIFFGALFTKLSSFFMSIILIRILEPEEFGILSYVLATLSFFIPFSGGGIQHSFMRFAPMYKENAHRNYLLVTSLKKGFLYSTVISICMFALIPWFDSMNLNTRPYFKWGIIYLYSYFFIDLLKMCLRVKRNNKTYAYVDSINTLILLVVGTALCYFFGLTGYFLVFVFTPILICVFYVRPVDIEKVKLPSGYISYGLWVGIGAVASQLMYSLDVFLVGKLIQDTTEVAIYRTASIIPIALFFIPNSYITTHYAEMAKMSYSKSFLMHFVKDYISLFLIVSMLLCTVLYCFSEYIILVLFGEEYIPASELFKILIIGMFGAFILRIPFGNILAAVGKSKWNAIVSFSILALNALLNYFAILEWGIKGAAIVTSLLLWISGVISMVLYFIYLNRLR